MPKISTQEHRNIPDGLLFISPWLVRFLGLNAYSAQPERGCAIARDFLSSWEAKGTSPLSTGWRAEGLRGVDRAP